MAEFILDEKTKKALYGLMPYSQNGTIDYTPDCYNIPELPESKRPIFKIRAFTNEELAEAKNWIYKPKAEQSKDYHVKLNDHICEYARRVTKGWENFFQLPDGKDVEFSIGDDGFADKSVFKKVNESIMGMIYRTAGKASGLYPIEEGSNRLALTEAEDSGLKS